MPGGTTPRPDHSHALVRPNSLRIGPDGLLWVLDTGQPGVDHGGPKFVAFDLETSALVRSYPLDAGALTGSFYDDFRFNGRNVYFTDIGHGAIVVLNLDTGALRRTLDGDPSTRGTRPMIVEGKELPPVKLPSKDDGVQQVLKPEPGRPGIAKGGESPARA